MKQTNPLIFLTIVMVVNALAYGSIIPLIYRYTQAFDMSPRAFAWLFVSYSAAQFLATPVIGRLSDRYGRKPLLLLSLFGTSIALALFASAQSGLMLFVARILDGITGGNLSVAQAVISDVTKPSQRAKAFGILGAAFGLGFLLGPAIGGLFSLISLSAPFWFAAMLALVGTVFGLFFLPETLERSHVEETRLFKFKELAKAVTLPSIGSVLLLTLIGGSAHTSYIIGFQSYTVDVLALREWQIGVLYSAIGLVGVVMQMLGLKWLIHKTKDELKVLQWGTLLSVLAFVLMALPLGQYWFMVLVMVAAVGIAPLQPVVASLISRRSRREDQGGIMGINSSYQSIAQIVGPIGAGLILPYSVSGTLLLPAVLMAVVYVLSRRIQVQVHPEVNL